jgi:group I intron endonuclease
MEIKRPVVYGIKNKINNKIYVGSAEDWKTRYNWHFNALERNKHFNNHLQNSWNKYGKESFEFIILKDIPQLINESVLDFKIRLVNINEQYYIDYYESFKPNKGYNIRKKANSALGIKRSLETRKKMSTVKIGIKNPMYGKKLSQESRLKLSISKSGIKHWAFGKKGKKCANSKAISQYTMAGVFLKTWDSISDVGRELEHEIPGIKNNLSHISACCKGKSKSVKGFIWKYAIEKTV